MIQRDLGSASGGPRLRGVVGWVTALAILLGLAGSAGADDVVLKNGEVFEGVVAVVSETHVVVDLPIGRLRFARSQVERVVPGASPLATLRERRAELFESPSASPSEWLALAHWARLAGLEEDAREIALAVAERSPLLDGLGPVMRGYGFVLDEADGWISKAEAMRRQGFVLDSGEWVTPEQRQARVAERAAHARVRSEELRLEREREDEARARSASRDGGASDGDVALEAVRLARAVVDQGGLRRGSEIGSGGFFAVGGAVILPGLPLSGGFPMVITPGAGDGGTGAGGPTYRGNVQIDWETLANRQPGSMIPMSSQRQQVLAGRKSP